MTNAPDTTLPADPLWPRAGHWPAWEGSSDAVLVGAPAFRTSLSPTGAHATPTAVREALRRFSPTLVGPPALDLTDILRIADAGDVDDPDGPEGEERLRARVRELASAALVVTLGGDNSVTYAAAQGAKATGLITIDAHFDLRDGISNGSPVRRLIEDGLDPRRIVQIGIADFANSAAYAHRAAELGITVVTLDELSRRGMDDVVAQALEIAGAGDGAVIHLDVDVDVCDRSVAPACPSSLPGGLAAWELRALVRALTVDPRVRSADIVEVDAEADAPDGRTVRLAALCVLEMLTGLAGRAVGRQSGPAPTVDAPRASDAASETDDTHGHDASESTSDADDAPSGGAPGSEWAPPDDSEPEPWPAGPAPLDHAGQEDDDRSEEEHR
ncbi:Formimidoylglutamase [Microbacterium sp. T2.11-28]|nr:Formimidoylglutamase [Microbacterium sp. T2.11-28]